MTLSYSLVNGADLVDEASKLLRDAWDPPVLHYSTSYLRWQLGFPSTPSLPAVAAFEANSPVGFIGAIARTLRLGQETLDVAVISFVAVSRAWRGQGVASELYRQLLRSLAIHNMPILTFGIPGSVGDKTLLRAYAQSGFQLHGLGVCDNYAYVARPGKSSQPSDSPWTAYTSEDHTELSKLCRQLSQEYPSTLWNCPQSDKFSHYFTDPRPRKLIIASHSTAGIMAAAFLVLSELQTAQGISLTPALDSLWMRGQDAGALQAILHLAADLWPSAEGAPKVITCPNLSGLDPGTLRLAGLRRTGAQFNAYFCTPNLSPHTSPTLTNLEII